MASASAIRGDEMCSNIRVPCRVIVFSGVRIYQPHTALFVDECQAASVKQAGSVVIVSVGGNRGFRAIGGSRPGSCAAFHSRALAMALERISVGSKFLFSKIR